MTARNASSSNQFLLCTWMLIALAAQAVARVAVACSGMMLIFILVHFLAGRRPSLSPRYLDRLTECNSLWLCSVPRCQCTDVYITRPIHRLAGSAMEFYGATYAFYLLAAAALYRVALESGSGVHFLASGFSMTWTASRLLLDKAYSCRLPCKLWPKAPRSVERSLRHTWIVWLALVTLTLAPTTDAALTIAKCVQDNCIQRRGHHTICYYPDPTEQPSRRLCVNPQLQYIMDIHREVDAIGPSIVYYEPQTSKPLGNSTLVLKNLQPDTGVVACATGLRSSAAGIRLYQTRCWLADTDEDFGSEYGDRACSVIHEQSRLLEPECESGEVHSPHFEPIVGISRAIRSVLGALAPAEVR